ncbi:MAG: hypothetical protein FJ253_05445, partial [Phycisphaerae bacterium]|nr:hypothetical protein [Phycisphaerae bacterium]
MSSTSAGEDTSRSAFAALLAAAMTFAASSATALAACPPDLDGSGEVDGADLGGLLGQWGDCPGCEADFDGNGVVDGSDLGSLLGAWGACPVEPESPRAMRLAGRALASAPWFEFVRAVNAGSSATIMIDTLLDPELVGAAGDLFVVEARSEAEWVADGTLVDVRGASQPILLVDGGAPANTISIDASALLSAQDGDRFGREYDLVVDLNANGTLDGGDLVDGFGDDPALVVLPNATIAGAHAVTVPPAYAVSGVTAGFTMERLYYPSDIASMTPRPLVVISHGNGHQYTWYDYLGNHLASWGYIVMSHQNNTAAGIEAASTTTLQHTAAIINLQATIAGGAINGKIDDTKIIWIGHSRGGEGVVRAYDRLFDGTYTPPSSAYTKDDIALLISIAPTDFLGKGGSTTGSDPHAKPYFLIYGAADGDVCGCPDNNVADSFNLYERAVGDHWSTYIHGADHNDFNCCGVNDFNGPAGTALGSTEVQKIAKVHMLAAIKSVIDESVGAKELRWRRYASLRPLGVLASAIVRTDEARLATGVTAVLDDFQTQTSTLISSSGGGVAFTVSSLSEGLSNDNNTSFTWLTSDAFNGQVRVGVGDTQRSAVFTWTAPGSIEWSVPAALKDFGAAAALSFRAGQGTRHPNGTAADSTLVVTLVDLDGLESSISTGPLGQGSGRTYQRTGFGTGAGWQNEIQTIRLRLDDFRRHGTPIDLSNIAAVRFEFGEPGESAAGR